jgi:hypothetical protein
MLSLLITKALAAKPLTLHEPLPDGTTEILVPTGACGITGMGCPLDTLNAFLRPLVPWIVGVAAGFSVLMIVIGGIMMIASDGDQGKIQKGRQIITASLIGLILLVFSATILNTLNADFFRLLS